MRSKPQATEYAESLAPYVGLVVGQDVMEVLQTQPAELERIAGSVDAEGELFRYAPGKWSVRQVFGHVIDAERVFAYRAFCISRGEAVSLPSFDENVYVEHAPYTTIPLQKLVAEFRLVRQSNLAFLGPMTEEVWTRTGTANTHPVSVRALAYVMAGHARHHMEGLRTHYGIHA
jgi:hypothetical protein